MAEVNMEIKVSLEGITADEITAAWDKFKVDAPYPAVFVMTQDGFAEAIKSLIKVS